MNPPNKLSASINDKLNGLSNRALNLVFATEVCGYEKAYEADENGPEAYRSGGANSCLYWMDEEGFPKFSEDISLVLPYLNWQKWAAGYLPNASPHYTVSVGEAHEIDGELTTVDGYSDECLARAACIALIRLRRLESIGRGEQ